MEYCWNGTDRGNHNIEYWWNDTDRVKQNIEYWWSVTDRGKQNIDYWWNDTGTDKFLLQPKHQPFNVVQGSNCSLLREIYGTRKPTMWRKWGDCNVNVFTAEM